MNANTTNLLQQSDVFVSRDERVAYDELTGGSRWDGGTPIFPEDVTPGDDLGGGGNGHADGNAPDGGRGGKENEETWEEYLNRLKNQSKKSEEGNEGKKQNPLLLVAALAILVISLK